MSATLVLDSSVALAWCFPDETSPVTDAILIRMRSEPAAVPSLWFLEITNVLAFAERRGRIKSEKVAEFLATIDDIEFEIDHDSSDESLTRLLPLCRAHNVTSYDAAYLDLAMRRRLPLATLDSALRRAANSVGVALLGQ